MPRQQKLITKAIENKLPALYGQEGATDPIVHLKLFTPWANWTWYVTERSEDTLFGLCVNKWGEELGYASLEELKGLRGPFGLRVERDASWRPTPLSKVRDGSIT